MLHNLDSLQHGCFVGIFHWFFNSFLEIIYDVTNTNFLYAFIHSACKPHTINESGPHSLCRNGWVAFVIVYSILELHKLLILYLGCKFLVFSTLGGLCMFM